MGKADIRVLLVDDTLAFLRTTADDLNYYGPSKLKRELKVRGCGSYDELAAIVEEQTFIPDIVVLDNNFEQDPRSVEFRDVLNAGVEYFAPRLRGWKAARLLPEHLYVLLLTAGDYRSPGRPRFAEIGLGAGTVSISDVLDKDMVMRDIGLLIDAIGRGIQHVDSFDAEER